MCRLRALCGVVGGVLEGVADPAEERLRAGGTGDLEADRQSADEAGRQELQGQLARLSRDEAIQRLVMDELSAPGCAAATRLLLLKAMAEYHDITLGDLLEGIVLHVFEGKAPFERASLERISQLKKIYGLDLDARHSHRLKEKEA